MQPANPDDKAAAETIRRLTLDDLKGRLRQLRRE
jgi:hypothetical protein